MISLHNVSSAAQALHYFSKDNYYTRDEGLMHSEWFGQGAQYLGLSGQIDQQTFFDVLDGKVGQSELGKWIKDETTGEKKRDHQPGIDITFSAPKSVSLLAEVHGKRKVREAHEGAVREALSYIETELAITRQTVNGKTEVVKTGNLTVAMFHHNTSRDLDPQTHTHAVVMNVTKRQDGQWRSLTNEEIYKAQRIIGAIYTAGLANRLKALGYDLYRTDERGNFEITGIEREAIQHFSQRRAQIEASLKARGIEISTATAKQKESATLKTRASKVNVDHDLLLSDWQDRAKSIGINFDAIEANKHVTHSKGDKEDHTDLIHPAGEEKGEEGKSIAAMRFAIAHLTEREAVVSKRELILAALEHSVGHGLSISEIKLAFGKLEKEGDLVALPGAVYTTKKMLASEVWSLDQVRTQKGKMPHIIDRDKIALRLAHAERKQGFKYNKGQKEAITTVLTSQDRYIGIQGFAGTGKTTMLRALREIAQEEGYTVRGMAQTGVASQLLARETGMSTNTVSMFQIKERQLQKDIAFAKQYAPDFERKPELWIVDESSLLGQRQKVQLDAMAEKAGAKVVYLGDRLQLQSIVAGKPFELAQHHGMQTVYMTEINRQQTHDLKQAVSMMTTHDALNESLPQVTLNHNTRAFHYMDKAGMIHEIPERLDEDHGKLITTVIEDILKLDQLERARTLVITAYNEDCQLINAGVRAGLKKSGALSYHEDMRIILVSKGWTMAMQKEVQYYKVGDVVRFGRDYQQIDARNGEYMRVFKVDHASHTVMLQKEDDSTIAWQPRKHNKVEIYEVDQRGLSIHDLIRMTRSEGILKNGEIARVVDITGDQATLELKQGRTISLHQVDLLHNKHWDHAYASTIHASQGMTQQRIIFHIRAPRTQSEHKQGRAIQGLSKVFGDRSFYVGVTRASHELRIYTNDKAFAALAVAARQDKTSAVETIERHHPRQNSKSVIGIERDLVSW